jgi:hypothetical protein
MKQKSATVLWMGAALGVALALAATVLAVFGTDAKSIGVALRLTARWSFLLFWAAYAVGSIAVLFGPTFVPLARRGRTFGLAFASAHLVHVGLVVWLYRISIRPPLSGSLFVFFAIGIVWTYVLAALSFGGLSEALGSRRWRLLRVVGMNYILLAFAYDFVLSVIHSGIVHLGFWRLAEYAPFASMSVAAPLLCLAAKARRRWEISHIAARQWRDARRFPGRDAPDAPLTQSGRQRSVDARRLGTPNR